MQDGPSNHIPESAQGNKTSRRALISWTLKLAGGAALATSLSATRGAQLAAAQDEIILTAEASEVGARPGAAYANGAAAAAAADSEAGATTGYTGVGGGRCRPWRF